MKRERIVSRFLLKLHAVMTGNQTPYTALDMDVEMQTELRQQYQQYTHPRLWGVSLFYWPVMLVLWFALMARVDDQGMMWVYVGPKGQQYRKYVDASGYMLAFWLGAILFYIAVYWAIRQAHIELLKDARYAKVIREQVLITQVMQLPSGHTIYYLDSTSVKAFEGPSGTFERGGYCTIYYLKHCKQLLEIHGPMSLDDDPDTADKH